MHLTMQYAKKISHPFCTNYISDAKMIRSQKARGLETESVRELQQTASTVLKF